MKTEPALDTTEESLENAQVKSRSSGLVPRSALFIGVGIFIIVLIIFATIDIISSSDSKSKSSKTETSGKKQNIENPNKKLDKAPSPSEIDQLAQKQVELANEQIKKNRFEIDSNVQATSNGQPLPGGTVGNLHAKKSPVLKISENNKSEDKIVTAEDERNATAEVSAIIAIGGSDSDTDSQIVSSLNTNGTPGSFLLKKNDTSPNQTFINTELERLNKLRSSSPFTMPSPQMPFNAGAPSPNQNTRPQYPVGVGSKDRDFMETVASETTAPAVAAQLPASNWMVFQGTRIPITTRESVNTDVPGSISAVSTSPVFDSINQCAVMIPTGTKFIGSYSSDIRPGQSRIVFAFKRMIFPDGKSVELSGAQATDQQGVVGVDGKVDNHFLEMFGYGFAVAWLADKASSSGSGVTVTQPNGSTTTSTIAGQVLAETAGRIMSRNAVIPPTITINGGARMFVTVVRDISLTPTSRTYCR